MASQRLAPCFFQHGLSKFLITLRSSPSEPLNFLIMEFKSSGLKDISNLGCNPQPQNQGTLVNLKAMVAPVQKVTMEDKENFDPRSATTTTTLISTTSKKAPQTTEKIDNEANSVMQDADSDISSA